MNMQGSTLKKGTMKGYRNQSGFALIVGLVILLLLTVIMLTALRVASLEERMAGNLRQQNIAFQAAESALREAEGLIRFNGGLVDWDGAEGADANPFHPLRLTGGPFQNTSAPICVNGLCGTTEPLQSASIRTLGDEAVRTAELDISGITEPQYVIELMRIEPSTDARRLYATFRVTARAWGEDPNSMVQLQSTYRSHVLSFVH